MQRSQTPMVLLYGIGIILALSLGFNAFLLMGQYPDHGDASYARPSDSLIWQAELQACSRASHQNDSVINAL